MKLLFIIVLLLPVITGCAQSGGNTPAVKDKKVGGGCEGCEAIYESPLKFDELSWETTLPGYAEGSPKIHISGTVYKKDGKTPAPGVVLYIYHTDVNGIYPTKGDEKGWARRHGYLRGWMKTDDKGRYSFYTIRPAAYPNQTQNPSHIHTIVKEEGKSEYWISDYLFEDDPILSDRERNNQTNVGGNGILKIVNKNGIGEGKRDIILGKNVRDYD